MDSSTADRTEWRTVGLAAMVYLTWVAVLVFDRQVAWFVTVPLLAVVVAWHGSLQHELLHGHPFTDQRANDGLASPPLGLRLPYNVYRRYHLAHHRCDDLTDPIDDPESFFVTDADWARMGSLRRVFFVAHQTFLGRLTLGPIYAALSVWRWQWRLISAGDRELARWWAAHVAAAACVLFVVVGVFDVRWWVYLLGAGYGSLSLGLIRSYGEHRWQVDGASRSAVVRSGPFFSLLFLNNNLHHAHHARPRAAWYELPALTDELGSDAAAAAGAGLHTGYVALGRRYLLRPIGHPVHPRHGLALDVDPQGTGSMNRDDAHTT